MNRHLLFTTLALALVFFARTCWAQTEFATHVVIDTATFPVNRYKGLQELADRVAKAVDIMIPGRMSEFVHESIVCYQIDPADSEVLIESQAPITFSDDRKWDFEPPIVVAGQSRIALSYAGKDQGQFVYQLAHELAHLKMGVRLDNYLVETFAMAVSQQILQNMGMVSYLNLEVTDEILRLPSNVIGQVKRQDVAGLQAYWQGRAITQGQALADRPFQTVGALLIRSKQADWAKLLGVALMNGRCPLNNHPTNITVCQPDLPRMTQVEPMLESLGFVRN